MKKLYSLIAVISASLAFGQTNLVQNPGFDNNLSNWEKRPTASYTVPTIFEEGYQSSNSAGYVNPSSTTGFFQNVSIEPGVTYVLSFWYKATGDGTDARLWSFLKDESGANVYLWDTAGEDPLRTNDEYLAPANDWTLHTVEFTNTNAVSLQLAVRSYSNSNTAYDEFSLVNKAELGLGEVVKSKYTLVANSIVSSEILFAAEAKNVQIFNSNGQLVQHVSVVEGTKLNVSSLPKGVYVVKGEVNGQVVVQKIVKK
ncbi:T9SS type A sorting domain-containing protein [Faecalibacter sp. LW9]|uniref:T9SS type A sorting domain-containing protein n=1 Tax=Faecalibacter sp. LW9 TaxID=3103144 RepID=UPI002AFF2B8B|nr:T9SS type A sorting domain-containing protein [Faecalibacter sp. LW9]